MIADPNRIEAVVQSTPAPKDPAPIVCNAAKMARVLVQENFAEVSRDAEETLLLHLFLSFYVWFLRS